MAERRSSPDGSLAPARGPSPVPGLAAVLFDLDGTLIDSEPQWRALYRGLADHLGVTLAPGWWSQLVGRSLGESVEVLAGRGPLPREERDELVRWLVDRGVERLRSGRLDDPGQPPVTWRPGARRLLEELHAAGVPTAVVTASPRRLLDAVADHLGLTSTTSVAGDEVTRPKPDPEGYLAAASSLGVDIADCVAVEDSPTGVAAAEASGARVLAVPHTVALADEREHTVTTSLAEVGVEDLAALPGRD
ncbi:MAG: HAD family phosphatase [Nitriliruptor sp.]|nr:MAG: HAD family phosphatase [Nitriliruptor sp.]